MFYFRVAMSVLNSVLSIAVHQASPDASWIFFGCAVAWGIAATASHYTDKKAEKK